MNKKQNSLEASLVKAGKTIFEVYYGIGAAAMGLLALLIAFTVVARYFFALSWKELSEFNVTLFAFTTFWGMGVCVLKNEHVIIDILYDRIRPDIKRWLAVVDYVIVLIVDGVFTYEGIRYVLVAGKQISQGMEIPMYFMYGIMPLAGMLCAVCIVFKIVEFILVDVSYFAPKNVELTEGKDSKGGRS